LPEALGPPRVTLNAEYITVKANNMKVTILSAKGIISVF